MLEFKDKGRSKHVKPISLDFETLGKEILAIDNAAEQNGLAIERVIMKIDLKDDFYATKSGREVRNRGIYFAMALQPIVDKMHDDHIHIDFVYK